MQTISFNSISAAKTIAETIEGFNDGVVLQDGEATATIRPGGEFNDYTEIRLAYADGTETARVSIERPTTTFGSRPATVSWSSSSSEAVGPASAAATARLLNLAAEVATQLNAWADAGQLPRLVPAPAEPRQPRGALVDLEVYPVGAPGQKMVATIRGRVLNASTECDIAVPMSEAPEVDWVFRSAGVDGDVNDLVEELEDGTEAIIIRNCQWEHVRLAEAIR